MTVAVSKDVGSWARRPRLTCQQCGGSWPQRGEGHRPRQCRLCGSRYWNMAPLTPLTCVRCRYTWTPTVPGVRFCARCRQRWDVPFG